MWTPNKGDAMKSLQLGSTVLTGAIGTLTAAEVCTPAPMDLLLALGSL